jgi:hypothetical protein
MEQGYEKGWDYLTKFVVDELTGTAPITAYIYEDENGRPVREEVKDN